MSRWFRHYAGMMRDEKLVRVAVKSKQPVERVVWVWGAILESAAEINDNGRYEFDAGEAAYFLRSDADEIATVLSELENAGRLAEGVVARWGDRQFSSDAGAERQRRYRERNRGSERNKLQNDHNGDADVTSRDGQVTPQETETDTKTEKKKKEGRSQATRLPADWQIPYEWLQEAQDAGMSLFNAHASASRMLNWSLSDPKGKKLDWHATWRNWFQRDLQKPYSTASPKTGGSPKTFDEGGGVGPRGQTKFLKQFEEMKKTQAMPQ
jgi:hypothetical protein